MADKAPPAYRCSCCQEMITNGNHPDWCDHAPMEKREAVRARYSGEPKVVRTEKIEGYTVQHYAHTEWKFILRPNGKLLGKAWSMQGVKRMIRKDAGTNTCDCGHLPHHHVDWRDDRGYVVGRCLEKSHGLPCTCSLSRSQASRSAARRRAR